jgi:hypothetical protein
VNYNSDELWFVGVYGQAVAKPTEIKKWEENSKFFKLLDKSYPRIKADRMLKDLSLIALAYSKLAVQQRRTFKPNPKGENSAPVAFQLDPNGELLELVLDLRSLTPLSVPRSLSPIKETEDEDASARETSKTFEVETKADRNLRQQTNMIDTWAKDEDHEVGEENRHALELYAQLTDDEFLYVQELQRVYDELRCYFVQWILSRETKELVNSARISAIQQGKKFTWAQTRVEILKSLSAFELHEDSQPIINAQRRNVSQSRFKHMKTKHHYIRKLIFDGWCKLVKIPTKTNTADMATKILPARTVSIFSKVVLGLDLDSTSTDDLLQLSHG